MTATNDDLGTVVGANNLLSFGMGADLTPASNAITITDRLHYLETGSFHTINVSGGNPSHAVDVILVPKTGATVTVTASGGNIAGTAPTMTAGVPRVASWDGTNWRFHHTGVAQLSGAAFTGAISSTSSVTGSLLNAKTNNTSTGLAIGSNATSQQWLIYQNTGAAGEQGSALFIRDAVAAVQLVTIAKSTGNTTFLGTIAERNRSVPMGEWTSVAYSAGNITANGGGTITSASGDQLAYSYTEVGKTITVNFSFDTLTLASAASTIISIAIPNSRVATGIATGACWVKNGGTWAIGQMAVAASGTTINITRDPSATAFTIGADNIGFKGTFTFQFN